MNEDEDVELTPLQQQVSMVREVYESLVDVSFTSEQALYIVSTIVCGGPRVPGED